MLFSKILLSPSFARLTFTEWPKTLSLAMRYSAWWPFDICALIGRCWNWQKGLGDVWSEEKHPFSSLSLHGDDIFVYLVTFPKHPATEEGREETTRAVAPRPRNCHRAIACFLLPLFPFFFHPFNCSTNISISRVPKSKEILYKALKRGQWVLGDVLQGSHSGKLRNSMNLKVSPYSGIAWYLPWRDGWSSIWSHRWKAPKGAVTS